MRQSETERDGERWSIESDGDRERMRDTENEIDLDNKRRR